MEVAVSGMKDDGEFYVLFIRDRTDAAISLRKLVSGHDPVFDQHVRSKPRQRRIRSAPRLPKFGPLRIVFGEAKFLAAVFLAKGADRLDLRCRLGSSVHLDEKKGD